MIAEDKGRAAATAVAGQLELHGRFNDLDGRMDRLAVLKWMVGANIALTILVLGKLLIA